MIVALSTLVREVRERRSLFDRYFIGLVHMRPCCRRLRSLRAFRRAAVKRIAVAPLRVPSPRRLQGLLYRRWSAEVMLPDLVLPLHILLVRARLLVLGVSYGSGSHGAGTLTSQGASTHKPTARQNRQWLKRLTSQQ